jgi:hypothetical protein
VLIHKQGQRMKAKRCGLAMGLMLVVLVTWIAWSGASAHRDAAGAPTSTSYASGEFFFPPYLPMRIGWGWAARLAKVVCLTAKMLC